MRGGDATHTQLSSSSDTVSLFAEPSRWLYFRIRGILQRMHFLSILACCECPMIAAPLRRFQLRAKHDAHLILNQLRHIPFH